MNKNDNIDSQGTDEVEVRDETSDPSNPEDDAIPQPIPIRAHTLLCLQGYSGNGYSPEFIAVMDRISQALRSDPNLEVKILVGADIFCEACPHHHRGRCMSDDPEDRPVPFDSPDNAVLMDKRVLQWLDLQEGGVEFWGTIVDRIAQYVDSSVMDVLCGDCSWRETSNCAEALDKLSNSSS